MNLAPSVGRRHFRSSGASFRGLGRRSVRRLPPLVARGLRLAAAIGFLALLGVPRAYAAHPRSEFERSVVEQTFASRKLEADEAPEGKLVEAVVFERLPVFDERDPVPDFLNVFHGTTRAGILDRELLFSPGQLWSNQKVEETERNLRGRRQLSLVLVVAARGSAPDRVVAVVITKDVWSLRLNSDFAIGPGGLEYLLLNPAEENAFGTWLSVGLLYRYEPMRQMLGGRFIAPRYFGTRYYLGAQAAPILRNSDFSLEGSTGQLVFERPQYSLRTDYAFGARLAWVSETSRRMLQTQVRDFVFVDPDTAEESRIPWEYRTERYAAEYYGLLSSGLENKRDLLFGLELDSRRFSTDFSHDPAPGVEAAFVREALPVSDRRMSPFVQLRLYEARFLRTVGLELLGLQEDYRLGFDLLGRLFVGGRAVGSTRDHVGTSFGASYTWPFGNGLVRLVASNRLVLANERQNEGASYAALRVASPSLGRGRLHLLVEGVGRYFDHLNVAPYALGGDGVLRGYRSGEFLGKNYTLGSVEYRSGSVDLLSAQVGFAFFVDVGAAANDFREFAFRSSFGTGLRVLFPQADRAVLRFDVGVPLEVEPGRAPASVFATFGHAFGMPGLATPSVTSGVSSF